MSAGREPEYAPAVIISRRGRELFREQHAPCWPILYYIPDRPAPTFDLTFKYSPTFRSQPLAEIADYAYTRADGTRVYVAACD